MLTAFKIFKKKETHATKEQAQEAGIRTVYAHGRITLAIARMQSFKGYGKEPEGYDVAADTRCEVNGVVYEENGTNLKTIQCIIEFSDRDGDSFPKGVEGSIGTCYLNTSDYARSDGSLDRTLHDLLLTGVIYDPKGDIRDKAYNVLKDAAISGSKFIHFGIGTEKKNIEEALVKMRSTGCGPSINIHSLKMWPDIRLPAAPLWGWHKD